MKTKIDQLEIFIKLAHHLISIRKDVILVDDRTFTILLQNMKITGAELKELHAQIEQITDKYRYVLLSPGETYSNINIQYKP